MWAFYVALNIVHCCPSHEWEMCLIGWVNYTSVLCVTGFQWRRGYGHPKVLQVFESPEQPPQVTWQEQRPGPRPRQGQGLAAWETVWFTLFGESSPRALLWSAWFKHLFMSCVSLHTLFPRRAPKRNKSRYPRLEDLINANQRHLLTEMSGREKTDGEHKGWLFLLEEMLFFSLKDWNFVEL